MAQTASDVRAGGAYYELNGRDNLSPLVDGIRAKLDAFGGFVNTFNPGAGGTGFLNRLVFGARDVDLKTGEYLGRVGGLVAPLRALFSPLAGGAGLVSRWVFGTQKVDKQTGDVLQVGGLLAPLRAMFSPGADGKGLVNRWLFGNVKTDEDTGAFKGRVGGLVPLALSAGNALVGAFTSAGAAVKNLGAGLTGVGSKLSLLGAGLSAPLLALFKGGVDRGADLANLSRELGLPIPVLNKLQYAADQAHVSLDEVMNDRSGRYSDLVAQAPTINSDDALAAAEAQRQLSQATRALQDALLPLVSTLAPLVKQFADWVKANAPLLAVLVPIAAAITAVGLACSVAGVAVGGLVSAFALLKSVVVGLGALLLSPWGLAVAAIGGATFALVRYTDSGRAAAELVRGELVSALDTARTAFGAIGNAIRKGDLEQAFAVAATGLDVLWADVTLKMTRAWNEFVGPIEEKWHQVTDGLGPPLRAAYAAVKAFAVDSWALLKQIPDGLARIWESVRGPVLAAVEFIKPLIAPLALPFIAVAKVVEAIWDGMETNIASTLINLAATLLRTWTYVGATIENVFRAAARTALGAAAQIAKALQEIDPKDRLGLGLNKAVDEIEALKKPFAKEGDRDIKKEIADIDAVKEAQKGNLRDQQNRESDQRQRARDQNLGGAEANLTAAQKALADAVAKANEPRVNGPEQALPPIREGLLGTQSVKGTFSSAALGQQLGVGDNATRQTELLKTLNDTAGNLPDEIARKLAPIVAAPRAR